MVELIVLKYIINKKDEEVLAQLTPDLFLDTQAKTYLKYLKDNSENGILTEVDLEALTHTKNIFKDIPDISESAINYFINQIKERHMKFNLYDSLYSVIEENSDFNEVVENIQSIILNTGKDIGSINEIDCSDVTDTKEDFIHRKALGFGKFDEVNGGLGTSELCLLGGHRGSGKSVLALHSALTRFKLGDTVAFISIEMRSNEVNFRLDAMSTGLPIKKIQFNKLSDEELVQYYLKKANLFCKEVDNKKLLEVGSDKNKLIQVYASFPKKKNKLFLYDLPSCTLTDIAFIAQKLKKQYNLKFLVVDYLNIIKVPTADDPIGWKTQIQRSEGLKSIARENDIAILSPIQTDEESKVKFAKAIEDPVDLSLIFKKAKVNEAGTQKFSIMTSKIRNGTEIDFELFMNKTNLQVYSKLVEAGKNE